MPFALIWLYCEFAFEILLRNLRKFILIWIKIYLQPRVFLRFLTLFARIRKEKNSCKIKNLQKAFSRGLFFFKFHKFWA